MHSMKKILIDVFNFVKSSLFAYQLIPIFHNINRHNSVYWNDNSQHEIMQQALNAPEVNVWAGILSHAIVGAFLLRWYHDWRVIRSTSYGDCHPGITEFTCVPALAGHHLETGWRTASLCSFCLCALGRAF